ncbi:hypothetical protein [Streptomyces sp. NPDC001508]|uniref:gamma carbonic anhydrase family protein n=1 Tax=Streptomyces sp. NPDC001508 TaxID=3154656 RepID=UPI00331BD342
MKFDHLGNAPTISDSAYVAPTATITGPVQIDAGASVLHGAILTAEFGARLTIGSNTVIMESAVLRASGPFDLTVGDSCLIGPQTYLTGCRIGHGCYLSRGVSVFNGADVGDGCWVTINCVLAPHARLDSRREVPAYHLVRGDKIFSPSEAADDRAAWDHDVSHSEFFDRIFRSGSGLGRTLDDRMAEAMERYSAALARHSLDACID